MTITTVGSGIGSSLAMVEETSYATVVTSPTWKFFEPVDQIQPKKTKTTKQSSGLAAGRLVDVASRRVVTSQGATISLPLEWCQANHFTSLLNQISSTFATGAAGSQTAAGGIYAAGARVTPSGSTYAYAHTFRNNVAGRSVAMQAGIPTTDGVLRQVDLLGAKPTKFAWSIEKDSFLTVATDWDARVYEDPLLTASYQGYPNGAGQTPYSQATPSYSAAAPWHWAQSQIQLGASATAASSAGLVDGVTKFQLSVEHPLNTARQYMGNAGLKDEQIVNGVYKITGTVTSDYLNKTSWADAFYSDTPFSIVVTFTPAGTLSGTVNAVQFVLNNVYLDNESPGAANKDIVNTNFPFTCLYDLAAEPLTVIIQTTDATV
jgi:hypothetical protein